MKYSEFREAMLRALHKNGNVPEGHLLNFQDLATHYELEFQPGWLIELQKELLNDGLLNGPSNGRFDKQAIGRLTGPGMRKAEQLIDDLETRGSILVDVHRPFTGDISSISSQLAPAADRFVSLGDNSGLAMTLDAEVEKIEVAIASSNELDPDEKSDVLESLSLARRLITRSKKVLVGAFNYLVVERLKKAFEKTIEDVFRASIIGVLMVLTAAILAVI